MKWPKICKAKELEPAFIGIINKDKKNCIVDCIYEHPKMLMNEFSDMLTLILERIFLENKERHVMGDFNIHLMNYETDNPVSLFLDNVQTVSIY